MAESTIPSWWTVVYNRQKTDPCLGLRVGSLATQSLRRDQIMHGFKRLIPWILVMTWVSVVVGGTVVGSLHFSALEQERARLTGMVRSQARLMESVARVNQQSLANFPGGPEAATLQQIEDAQREYTGFGRTGGLVFGRRAGDQIIFLHSHRAGIQRPQPVPFDSQLAEPMRRALRGRRGTVVGPDYRGTAVLAAYEPVAELDLGIVAKIDVAEVRAPFVRAAVAAAGAGSLCVMLGAVFFVCLIRPGKDGAGRAPEASAIARDDPGSQQAPAAPRESEQGLRIVFEQAAVGVALIETSSGRFVRINQKYCELLGYTESEMLATTFQNITHPEDLQEDLENMRRMVAGEIREFAIEKRYLRRDGSVVWVNLTVSPTWEPGQDAQYHIAIVQDISDRREAQEALRQEHEFSESLTNTAQNIVLVLDMAGRIVRFNPYMEGVTGWRLDEVRGCDWFDTFLPEHNREPIRSLFARAIGGQRTLGNINAILTKEGYEREIAWYDAPLTNGGGELIGLLCTGLDVTERRTLEREILEIAAEEQRRIGQELHDSTQQQMTGLSLVAQNVAKGLAKLGADPAHAPLLPEAGLFDRIRELHRRAQQVHSGLETAAREVNQLSRGLIPVEVDAQGLMSSLTELARRVSEVQNVQCTFTSDRAIDVPDNFTATHLYRIAQEAVNNALKHSSGDRIVLSLAELNDVITLKVRDNGNGMDGKRAQGPGMGLRIMTYRADLIGATLVIGQANGGGTEVACTVTNVDGATAGRPAGIAP